MSFLSWWVSHVATAVIFAVKIRRTLRSVAGNSIHLIALCDGVNVETNTPSQLATGTLYSIGIIATCENVLDVVGMSSHIAMSLFNSDTIIA
ncbi:MAG: hypothetical protein Q4B80_03550 [Aerococcaceae bacterium]|nr:hypothetical protein [Aerococcaceae bacterium]